MLGISSSLASASIHEQRYSVKFDGVDDYITADGWQPGETDGYEALGSVSVWVKKEASESDCTIFGTSVDTATENQILLFYDISEEALVFNYTGDNTTNIEARHEIPDSEFIAHGWVHIAVTWNEGAGENSHLYFNGELVASSETDLEPFVGYPNRFHIGTSGVAVTKLWKGRMSEFALWNLQLTANAVEDIYNSRNPHDLNYDFRRYTDFSGKLLAYWQMDDGSGIRAKDSKRLHTADGTLVNMAGDATTWSADTPDD